MALYAARIGAHSAQIKALGIIAVKYRIATPANQCLWHRQQQQQQQRRLPIE